MIDPERGGEASALSYFRAGEIMLVGSVGAAAGAIAGALSTEVRPANIQLDKGVDIEASFAFGKEGLIAQNDGDELSLPNAPVSTPMPGFKGVKLKLKNGDVVRDVTQAIDNPKSIKKFTKLAAQPQAGVVEPIKDALTLRLAEGTVAGAILLPVIGYVAVKRLRPIKRMHNITPGRARVLAYPAAAALLVGCGVSGDQMIQQIEPTGSPLPTEIANRSPLLKDATVNGSDLKNAVKKVVASFDEGKNAWRIIDKNLRQELSDFERVGGLDYKYDLTTSTRLYQDSALCNVPYIENVLPTLISKLDPAFFGDTGDRRTNGNTWPYEGPCEPKIQQAIGDTQSFQAVGNHDAAPDKDEVIVRVIDGVTHVTYHDPRSERWGHDNPPLLQSELNKQIGEQGSKLAEVACRITDQTGRPPEIEVHTPEAGFEAGLAGCATNITSSHGIRHNDNKNTTVPIISRFQSLNGRQFGQLINVTSSGSVDNRSTYKAPGKNGAVVLAEYNKADQRFMRAIRIIFKKDKTVKIDTVEEPPVSEPTTYMLSFVRQNSPTAEKVAGLP